MRTPTIQLHKDLKLLLVQDIHNISIAHFIHKQRNNLLPEVFHNYFKPISVVHHHNTKHSNKLFLESKRIQQGKIMTHYRGTLIWNSLPNIVTAIQMTASLKKICKNVLLKQIEKTVCKKYPTGLYLTLINLYINSVFIDHSQIINTSLNLLLLTTLFTPQYSTHNSISNIIPHTIYYHYHYHYHYHYYYFVILCLIMSCKDSSKMTYCSLFWFPSYCK